MDRLAWHDCRYGVLIDQLRVSITTQQDTEIVKPSDDPLKLNAVYKEDRERRLVLPNMIQKRVLQALCSFSHFFLSVLVRCVWDGGPTTPNQLTRESRWNQHPDEPAS